MAVRERRSTNGGGLPVARRDGEAAGEELATEPEAGPARSEGDAGSAPSTESGDGSSSCPRNLASPQQRPSRQPATLFRSESLKLSGVVEPVEASPAVAPPGLVSAPCSSVASRRHSFCDSGRAGFPFRRRTRFCFARSSCAFRRVFSAAEGDKGELERRSKTARRAKAGAAFGMEAGDGGGGTGEDGREGGGDARRMCGARPAPCMLIGSADVAIRVLIPAVRTVRRKSAQGDWPHRPKI